MEPEFRTISSSAAPGDPTSEGAAESSWKSMNARAIGEARLGKIITDYCKAGFSADVAGYRERYVEAGVVDWGAMGEGWRTPMFVLDEYVLMYEYVLYCTVCGRMEAWVMAKSKTGWSDRVREAARREYVEPARGNKEFVRIPFGEFKSKLVRLGFPQSTRPGSDTARN